ncbi:MAG: IS605 OrfB-like transposable element containing RNAse H-like and Zn finger domain [Candidatus Methanohalarchaeum thermophilum]|uniref:IS605 OrfB-like transposable element containing RNAse H-like and Zn finger domain n=1 Tax=Methanohalarchaeum thermophilum TaxID=1903181 RepID=A0A1Q6DTH3_METT1|nr:MAG: IS605 OrfB-like transposable element containing RNAse H-like and Zn finger domain [Candidatus Methanohalarchaeum thermophilum]
MYGGITVPVELHEEIKREYNMKDLRIVRKSHGFGLHLSVFKEVGPVEAYRGALGVDLGLDKFAYLC